MRVPTSGGPVLDERTQATQPDPPDHRSADQSVRKAMVPTSPYLSSLARGTVRRQDPRQEPDAVMPPVRICGGGREQLRFLLRQARRRVPATDGPLWFCARRWRGLSRKGTNRTRVAENEENVHLAVRDRIEVVPPRDARHGPGPRPLPSGTTR